jgi:hypothetical protein
MTKTRTAIIELNLFSGYTGTTVPTGYKFLCWDDQPESKKLVDDIYNNGGECITIGIPIEQ